MEGFSECAIGTVDLGRADAPTLRRELTGAGETKALAIVAYRESIGLFVADELFEVKGIDKALPDKNREKSRLNYACKSVLEAGH